MDDFTALYHQYSADVYRFALYLSGDPGEAEDITSEAFVRIWNSNQRVEMATVKAYLFTIARNLFLHGLRTRSRNVVLDDELPDEKPDPEMQAGQKAELRRVLQQLQQLREIDRAALLMRAMHEMPYEEIARSLGISLASAKVRVHRARLALADLRTSCGHAGGTER
jgi:RNA polymerase sigma-70 factor (ECF subfamily)